MSTFRNSTVPEWSTNEHRGYFPRRHTMSNPSNEQRATGSSDHVNSVGVPHFGRTRVTYLPKDLTQATSELKETRVWKSVKNAYFWQLIAFVVMFSAFVRIEIDGKPIPFDWNFMPRIFRICFAAVICTNGMMFILTLYLTVSMFSVLLTSNADKYGVTIHQQMKRYTSWRFLLKPLFLICFVNFDCLYFLELFDPAFMNFLRSKKSSTDCGLFSEPCFFMEDTLVIRISISVAALDFYLRSYFNGQFTLKFPSYPVKRYIGALFEFKVVAASARSSFLLSLGVWISCLTFGPLIYSTCFSLIGVKIWEDKFVDRIFLFLEVGFIVRVLVYTFLTRTMLPLLLKVVNYHLSDVVNFPVESSPGHEQHMLLNEAMKTETGYLKFLAFHEYSLKVDNGNSDISVFFNVTHPGNHPLNWRSLFGASISVIKEINLKVVCFLKTAKIPPNFLQSGLGPHILNLLRERETVEQPASVSNERTEIRRGNNMRDLTSSNRPDLQNEIPTITEAIRQNLELVWNDLRAAIIGFFNMQTVNNLVVGGGLDTTIRQNVIANILSDHLLSYWAITGTMKLLCVSVRMDTRGIVNQDIKPFVTILLEAYDIFAALEIYINKSIDDEPGVNRKVLENNRQIAAKMYKMCAFALAKLHNTFQICYPILGIEGDLESRILEIISNRS